MKDTKAKKTSNVISEAKSELDSVKQELTENSKDIVRDLLAETVREELNKIILSEGEEDENEYDVEEVNDIDTDTEDESGEGDDSADTEETDSEVEIGAEVSDDTEDIDNDEGDEWSEFEDYKVDDGSYDFSKADGDTVKKVFKLLNNDDEVVVSKDGDMTHIKDNETGAEYIITSDEDSIENDEDNFDLDIDSETEIDGDDSEMEFELGDDEAGEEEFSDEEEDDEDIYEITLSSKSSVNEYDSHVGYTDNYQNKDAMTTDGMTEPANAKSTNDWDKGVPKGTKKPWAGKGNTQPFDKPVSEEVNEEEEEVVEEGPARTSVKLSHKVKSATNGDSQEGRPHRSPNSVNGVLTKEQTNVILKKAKMISEENAELKEMLSKFRTALNETIVTNLNLGKIVKLITEHTTTQQEKMDIIERFGNEAKTKEDSQKLYESIKKELSKNQKTPIKQLDEQMTVDGSKKINEVTAYRSDELNSIHSLMERISRI
jgi:hypothetical protein